MKVAIASIFRNSVGYLPRYFNQVARLALELERRTDTLSIVVAEGDSTDATEQELRAYLKRYNGIFHTRYQIKAEHGGPSFGSVDNAERWRNISFVCNALLRQVTELKGHEVVIYVESDLIWEPDVMLQLIDDLHQPHVDAAAPLCIHQPTNLFYDTWGHRSGGVRFGQYPPYHAMLDLPGAESMQNALYPLDSAGSCIAMASAVANHARFEPPELGIVGFGQDMRRLGFNLMLDPSVSVYHP
jgi:glycosyltransferase involved in cell wall biosynthesis